MESDAETVVVTRTLRYPRNWPNAKPEEKGIDVALAVDYVMMAVRGQYDVGIILSADTDLKPALEAVAAMDGDPYPRAEVAAWSSAYSYSRRLSIPHHKLWCHWLDDAAYGACRDVTNYVSGH